MRDSRRCSRTQRLAAVFPCAECTLGNKKKARSDRFEQVRFDAASQVTTPREPARRGAHSRSSDTYTRTQHRAADAEPRVGSRAPCPGPSPRAQARERVSAPE